MEHLLELHCTQKFFLILIINNSQMHLVFPTPLHLTFPVKFSLSKSKTSAMLCVYVEVICSYYTKNCLCSTHLAISMTGLKIWCIIKSDVRLLNIGILILRHL